jgi:hypothetical protein
MNIPSLKLFFLTIILVGVCGTVHAQSLTSSPTGNQRETSPFGWRDSTNSNHLAVDYGANSAGVGGDNVYSSHGGTVVESRYQTNGSGGWGNTVVVESASGNYRTRYSHLQDPGIANGSTIAPGQQVGLMGGTGRPGGYAVHLDYAVMVKDPATGEFHAIDPNEAAGMDLDDPAVRAQLIEDAKTKINGELRTEGDPQGGNNTSDPNSGSGSSAAMIGCDNTIYDQAKTKVKALRQQETEAAKALITKPVSVQQLTCFDQYAKTNAEEIGKIRSKPDGDISASINPIVKDTNLMNLAANFMGGTQIPGLGDVQNVLNGGLQSMMNDALGGLTGGLFGAAGGAQGCNAMDEMFNLMQCVDFPEMPSLPDILGGAQDKIGGVLSGLNQASEIAGAIGTLGSGEGGGGVLGAVCQAVKGKFGGGGSGGTDVYENLFQLNQNLSNLTNGQGASNTTN